MSSWMHRVGRVTLRQWVNLVYEEPVGCAPRCDWQILRGQKLRSITGQRPRRQPGWIACAIWLTQQSRHAWAKVKPATGRPVERK